MRILFGRSDFVLKIKLKIKLKIYTKHCTLYVTASQPELVPQGDGIGFDALMHLLINIGYIERELRCEPDRCAQGATHTL